MNLDIRNKENYIWIAKQQSSNYYKEFIQALKIIEPHLTTKEFKNLLDHKLQFSSSIFDKPKYLQHAVELSVLRYFAEYFKETFQYEYNANPENNTDVECRIKHNGFTYNIEVKTPVLDKKYCDLTSGLLGRSLGQLSDENYKNIPSEMDKALGNKVGSSKMINFNLKLKDFLKDSNKKFNAKALPTEANILIIGLDDIDEIILWSGYLKHEPNKGLFTNNSFENRTEYSNVDFVVLTNLLYKHKNALENKCTGYWDLKNCFSIMINNPRINRLKKDSLFHFAQICPNYNFDIANYTVMRENEHQIAKYIFKMKFFIEDELEKNRGIYLFDKK